MILRQCLNLRKEGLWHEGQRTQITGRKRQMGSALCGHASWRRSWKYGVSSQQVLCLQIHKASSQSSLVFILQLVRMNYCSASWCSVRKSVMPSTVLGPQLHSSLSFWKRLFAPATDIWGPVGLSPTFAQWMVCKGQWICLVVLLLR